MRLTAVCNRYHIHRLRDYSWQRWRKPAIMDTRIATKLREQGKEVVDAYEYVREMDRDLYPRDWKSLQDMKPVFPKPPGLTREHPDWHDKPVLMFNSESFPMEGVNQAMAFSKSVKIKEGLPDELLERCNFSKMKNPEEAAERIVKQAFLWDAYLEKLPNLKNFDYPTRNFRRPFGIPARRSNDILVRNFIRLIEQEDPQTASARMISNDEEFRVNLTRHGSAVQINISPLLALMTKGFTAPFENSKLVEDSKALDTPNIYPFLSTTNFEECNIFKSGDFFAVKPNSLFSNIHTAVFSHHIPGSHTHVHPRWNYDRYSGTTIMYSFATALLMAHRKFGDIASSLPEPVTSQVLHLTGKEFQFCVFQLNTLDLEESSTSKIKNFVWITDKINLFDHVENKLGLELLEGYNATPFKILKGMYSTPTL